MLPNFLIEETTIREAGESSVFDASETPNQPLQLTLGITHAVEHESISVDILVSKDGRHWMSVPVASFTPKCYCGTYKLRLPPCDARYLKAVWRPMRWSRVDQRPFFRFYLHAEPVRDTALAASAA
jgi:hypothetical protein